MTIGQSHVSGRCWLSRYYAVTERRTRAGAPSWDGGDNLLGSFVAAILVTKGGEVKNEKVPLHKAKDDLSRYLGHAEKEEIVITRHGKPAGVLIGFSSEDDWFAYRLEHDPRFLRRISQARSSIVAGKGIKLDEAKL